MWRKNCRRRRVNGKIIPRWIKTRTSKKSSLNIFFLVTRIVKIRTPKIILIFNRLSGRFLGKKKLRLKISNLSTYFLERLKWMSVLRKALESMLARPRTPPRSQLEKFCKEVDKKSQEGKMHFSLDGRTKNGTQSVFAICSIHLMNTICLGSDDPRSFVLSLCDEWTLEKDA